MKEQFFKYRGWYYPMQSISFRINYDRTLGMFHLSEDEAVAIFSGKQAEHIVAILNELSLDIELAEEERG